MPTESKGRPAPRYPRRGLTDLFKVGEMRRGDIQNAAHIERRQATKIAAHLLESGYVASDSPKGPLRLNINKDIARALFPEFFE